MNSEIAQKCTSYVEQQELSIQEVNPPLLYTEE